MRVCRGHSLVVFGVIFLQHNLNVPFGQRGGRRELPVLLCACASASRSVSTTKCQRVTTLTANRSPCPHPEQELSAVTTTPSLCTMYVTALTISFICTIISLLYVR